MGGLLSLAPLPQGGIEMAGLRLQGGPQAGLALTDSVDVRSRMRMRWQFGPAGVTDTFRSLPALPRLTARRVVRLVVVREMGDVACHRFLPPIADVARPFSHAWRPSARPPAVRARGETSFPYTNAEGLMASKREDNFLDPQAVELPESTQINGGLDELPNLEDDQSPVVAEGWRILGEAAHEDPLLRRVLDSVHILRRIGGVVQFAALREEVAPTIYRTVEFRWQWRDYNLKPPEKPQEPQEEVEEATEVQ